MDQPHKSPVHTWFNSTQSLSVYNALTFNSHYSLSTTTKQLWLKCTQFLTTGTRSDTIFMYNAVDVLGTRSFILWEPQVVVGTQVHHSVLFPSQSTKSNKNWSQRYYKMLFKMINNTCTFPLALSISVSLYICNRDALFHEITLSLGKCELWFQHEKQNVSTKSISWSCQWKFTEEKMWLI
jgi:hypothetical protein